MSQRLVQTSGSAKTVDGRARRNPLPTAAISCGASAFVDPTGIAKTFGAEVSLPMEGTSLFFVVGRAAPPDSIIRGFGGVVLTHLPDARRVLAVLPLEAYAGLGSHPALAIAGPVSLDAERFGRFARLVGLDEAHPP